MYIYIYICSALVGNTQGWLLIAGCFDGGTSIYDALTASRVKEFEVSKPLFQRGDSRTACSSRS